MFINRVNVCVSVRAYVRQSSDGGLIFSNTSVFPANCYSIKVLNSAVRTYKVYDRPD